MPVDPRIVPTVALNDGTSIPQIGFGTWQVAPEEAEAATREALACGYRHIDTAAVYANENEVGAALADSGLARDDVYVTTKLWNPDHGYDAAMRRSMRAWPSSGSSSSTCTSSTGSACSSASTWTPGGR